MNNNSKLRELNLLHKEQGYRLVNRIPRDSASGCVAQRDPAHPPPTHSPGLNHRSRKDNAEIRPMFRPFPLWLCWMVIVVVMCVFSFIAGVTIGAGFPRPRAIQNSRRDLGAFPAENWCSRLMEDVHWNGFRWQVRSEDLCRHF